MGLESVIINQWSICHQSDLIENGFFLFPASLRVA